MDFFATSPNGAVTMNYIISEEDRLQAVKANLHAGPDSFPIILLESYKRALTKPLKILFQSFVANSKLSSKLKE